MNVNRFYIKVHGVSVAIVATVLIVSKIQYNGQDVSPSQQNNIHLTALSCNSGVSGIRSYWPM